MLMHDAEGIPDDRFVLDGPDRFQIEKEATMRSTNLMLAAWRPRDGRRSSATLSSHNMTQGSEGASSRNARYAPLIDDVIPVLRHQAPRLPDGDCVFISDRWDRITKRTAGPAEHGLSAGVRRLHACDTACPFVTSCGANEPIGDGDIGRKTMHQLLPSNPIARSLMCCVQTQVMH